MKLLGSVLLVLAVLFTQVGTVAAAPQTQDTTPISGTIQSITTEIDTNGVTTVLVTFQDGQTVRVSVETAVALGLVTVDPTTGVPTVDQTKVGQTVEIDPTTVIPAEEVHPIADLLGDFFDVDPSVVNDYHEDGFGFGVIAQAMWLSQSVTENGDASATGCILDAKRNGTYDACFDFGDEPVPANWGQFKKALKQNKDKHNLGVIVSGHADDDAANDQNNGNGKNNENKKPKKPKGNGKP